MNAAPSSLGAGIRLEQAERAARRPPSRGPWGVARPVVDREPRRL